MSVTDYEAGSVVPVEFGSYDTAGVLTNQIRAVGQAGVDPVLRVIRSSDRNSYTVPAGQVTINEFVGRHVVRLLTQADPVFFVENDEYELRFQDCEIYDGASWRSVTNQPAGNGARFALGTTSAGIVRRRAIVAAAGAVVTVLSPTEITVSIDGVDHAGDPEDIYRDQFVIFQHPAANAGLTRRVLKSVVTGSNVTLTFHEAFPRTVTAAERFAISPGVADAIGEVSGSVIAVTDESNFTISLVGIDHSGYPVGSNPYPNQPIVFTTGPNRGMGRGIRSSAINGANVDVAMQVPFPNLPVVGDRLRLSPGPGIGEAGIAHHSANFSGATLDRYYVWWSLNNDLIRPDDLGGGNRCRIDILDANAGTIIQSNAQMEEYAQGLFRWDESTNRIPAGSAATMTAKGRINGIDYAWARTFPNVAQEV